MRLTRMHRCLRRVAGNFATALALTSAAALLAGCTGLFKSSTPPDQTYTLRPPAAPAPAPAPAPVPAPAASVRVVHPTAAPGLDTAHILLARPGERLDSYAGSRWPVRIPDLVGSLAVGTLRASGEWTAVADAGSPFPADYLLSISVRRFEAEYAADGAAPTVTVALDCTLGRRAGREVLATYAATGTATAGANRMSEVIAAFQSATDSALGALARDTLAAVRTDRAQADAASAAQKGAVPAASSSR